MRVFRDYRLIECETTMRCLNPVAIREFAVFNTENVAPVIHDHKFRDHSQGGGTHWIVCSHCEKQIDWQDAYCKHCGAKMDGDPDA